MICSGKAGHIDEPCYVEEITLTYTVDFKDFSINNIPIFMKYFTNDSPLSFVAVLSEYLETFPIVTIQKHDALASVKIAQYGRLHIVLYPCHNSLDAINLQEFTVACSVKNYSRKSYAFMWLVPYDSMCR